MTTPVLETKKRSDSFFNLFLEKDKIFFLKKNKIKESKLSVCVRSSQNYIKKTRREIMSQNSENGEQPYDSQEAFLNELAANAHNDEESEKDDDSDDSTSDEEAGNGNDKEKEKEKENENENEKDDTPVLPEPEIQQAPQEIQKDNGGSGPMEVDKGDVVDGDQGHAQEPQQQVPNVEDVANVIPLPLQYQGIQIQQGNDMVVDNNQVAGDEVVLEPQQPQPNHLQIQVELIQLQEALIQLRDDQIVTLNQDLAAANVEIKRLKDEDVTPKIARIAQLEQDLQQRDNTIQTENGARQLLMIAHEQALEALDAQIAQLVLQQAQPIVVEPQQQLPVPPQGIVVEEPPVVVEEPPPPPQEIVDEKLVEARIKDIHMKEMRAEMAQLRRECLFRNRGSRGLVAQNDAVNHVAEDYISAISGLDLNGGGVDIVGNHFNLPQQPVAIGEKDFMINFLFKHNILSVYMAVFVKVRKIISDQVIIQNKIFEEASHAQDGQKFRHAIEQNKIAFKEAMTRSDLTLRSHHNMLISFMARNSERLISKETKVLTDYVIRTRSVSDALSAFYQRLEDSPSAKIIGRVSSDSDADLKNVIKTMAVKLNAHSKEIQSGNVTQDMFMIPVGQRMSSACFTDLKFPEYETEEKNQMSCVVWWICLFSFYFLRDTTRSFHKHTFTTWKSATHITSWYLFMKTLFRNIEPEANKAFVILDDPVFYEDVIMKDIDQDLERKRLKKEARDRLRKISKRYTTLLSMCFERLNDLDLTYVGSKSSSKVLFVVCNIGAFTLALGSDPVIVNSLKLNTGYKNFINHQKQESESKTTTTGMNFLCQVYYFYVLPKIVSAYFNDDTKLPLREYKIDDGGGKPSDYQWSAISKQNFTEIYGNVYSTNVDNIRDKAEMFFKSYPFEKGEIKKSIIDTCRDINAKS